MGDLKTLAKARMELEELYSGIPDDSVNLTFQDLAEIKQSVQPENKMKPSSKNIMEPVQEAKTSTQGSPLNKWPSLDFSRGLRASNLDHHHHHHYHDHGADRGHHQGNHLHHHDEFQGLHGHGHHQYGSRAEFMQAVESSMAYDDVSVMSINSMYQDQRGGRPRRPGIPHANICTICSIYIYIFRHRCLVCGRVYCRDCVSMGMGEMTEGRKCIQCLGRRFSQRYIKRAGDVGCFCSRYPSSVKQAELKWAEKGPRGTGEKAYGHGTITSRSRSPVTPRTPTRVHNNPPSFVASSPYSPYTTPMHHHLPL